MCRKERQKNPFERGKPSESNPIVIIVHTDFFTESFPEYSQQLKKLINISKLCFVSLLFLPARKNNSNLKDLYQEEDILIGEYVDTNYRVDCVAVRYGEAEIEILNGNLAKWREVFAGNSKVRILDLQVLTHIEPDYFVMSSKDEFYKKQPVSAKKITINNLLQELRILLVYNGIYYDRPNSRFVGDEPYYSYRVRLKFPQFIESNIKWSSITKEKFAVQHSNFSSLYQRLYLISKAMDKIDFHSLRNPNNDTLNECLYHIGYLIMLVTGVFDGIAWIISDFYKIDLSRMKISIQVPIGKQKSDFIKKLQVPNFKLYDYLLNEKTQRKINIIYQIRHSLQHRSFIQGMGQSTAEKKEPNLLFLPHESPDFFEGIIKDEATLWGFELRIDEGKLFDLRTFTHRVFEVTRELVNNTLSLLIWDIPLEALNSEERMKLEKQLEDFKQFRTHYHRVGKESMYFN